MGVSGMRPFGRPDFFFVLGFLAVVGVAGAAVGVVGVAGAAVGMIGKQPSGGPEKLFVLRFLAVFGVGAGAAVGVSVGQPSGGPKKLLALRLLAGSGVGVGGSGSESVVRAPRCVSQSVGVAWWVIASEVDDGTSPPEVFSGFLRNFSSRLSKLGHSKNCHGRRCHRWFGKNYRNFIGGGSGGRPFLHRPLC